MKPHATGRLYISGRLVTEFPMPEEEDCEDQIRGLLLRYPAMLTNPHMIEIEFHDAPLEERFCRFGTDPNGMVAPMQLPGGFGWHE